MKKRRKKKGRTDYEIWKEYRKSIALEKEREKERRETERGRFEASMCHIDFAALDNGEEDGEADNDRPREWESDDGEGGEDIRSFDEPTAMANQSEYTRRLHNARRRLERHDRGLLPVFDLVVKNGKNWKESVWELMRTPIAPVRKKQTARMKRKKARERQRKHRACVIGTRQKSSTMTT